MKFNDKFAKCSYATAILWLGRLRLVFSRQMYNPEIVIIYILIFRDANKFVMQFYRMVRFSRFNGREMDRVLLISLCLVCVRWLNDCSTAWEPNEIQIYQRDKG